MSFYTNLMSGITVAVFFVGNTGFSSQRLTGAESQVAMLQRSRRSISLQTLHACDSFVIKAEGLAV